MWSDIGSKFLPGTFSVLALNIRSISNKFAEFLANLIKKFTLIIIVETWLQSPTDCGFEIDGYKSNSVNREKF